MNTICKWIGLLAIAVTLILPFAYFADQVSAETMKLGLFIATLVWFATSVFWIGKKPALNLDDDPLL